MKYLIILLLLLPSLKSIAQKNKKYLKDSIRGTILEINPNADGFAKTRLLYGSTVKFKITNVNLFKIEGTNSISKESISFEVPAQLSQLLPQESAGDMQSIAEDNGGNVFTGMLDSANSVIPIEKIQKPKHSIRDPKEIFINNYNSFLTTLNKLSLYTSVDTYIDSLLQETFIIDTATLKSNLRGYMVSINDDNTDINLLRGKCKTALENLNKYYIEAKGAYDELAKKIKDEKVIASDWASKDKNAKIKIDSLYITVVREKIFEKEFQFLTANYDTINTSSKRLAIISKTNAGIDYYYRVQNAKFEVYTDAQQLNDDKITITPKLKNAKGDIVKEYNPVEIKTYGGWKVDVSTGYLLSFRGDENYTNLYDASGITGVQKNNTDNLKHAIGALFNAYPRTGRDFNVGLSIGFSIPTDGSSIGFYGGVSALILEKNRLVITFGVAENRTKLLNTGNLIKDEATKRNSGKETYKFSNADYKEIKYDNVYRPAIFVGLSYNIFTIKKSE